MESRVLPAHVDEQLFSHKQQWPLFTRTGHFLSFLHCFHLDETLRGHRFRVQTVSTCRAIWVSPIRFCTSLLHLCMEYFRMFPNGSASFRTTSSSEYLMLGSWPMYTTLLDAVWQKQTRLTTFLQIHQPPEQNFTQLVQPWTFEEIIFYHKHFVFKWTLTLSEADKINNLLARRPSWKIVIILFLVRLSQIAQTILVNPKYTQYIYIYKTKLINWCLKTTKDLEVLRESGTHLDGGVSIGPNNLHLAAAHCRNHVPVVKLVHGYRLFLLRKLDVGLRRERRQPAQSPHKKKKKMYTLTDWQITNTLHHARVSGSATRNHNYRIPETIGCLKNYSKLIVQVIQKHICVVFMPGH